MILKAIHACVVNLLVTGFLITVLPPATSAQSVLSLAELLRSTHIHGLAVDRTDSARLLLATHNGLYLLHVQSRIVVPASRSRDDFMGFTPHPIDPNILYASGHPDQGGNLGFIASMDMGKTWETLSPGSGGPVDFHQMDVSKADPEIIYGAHQGLQQSLNGGRTWRKVGSGPEGLIDLAASAIEAERVYFATEQGLLISQDSGHSWQPAHPIGQPASVVETTGDGSVYTFILGSGLFRAEEQSLSWQTLNNNFQDRYFLHLAIDARDSNRLFASTQHNELLASSDGGKSWQLVAAP